MNKPTVLIYRDQILAPSETFIKAQAEHINDFNICFMGSRRIKGLDLNHPIYLINEENNMIGKVKEGIFKLSGYNYGITNELGNENIQLVHAHFGPDGVFALPVAMQLQVPLIVTFHGYDITTKDEYMKKSLSQRIYLHRKKMLQAKGACFIAVSQFIKGKLIANGYPEEKILQHYIGVDTDYFTKYPAIERKNIVLFVGRLVENKGAEYLIRGMSLVQKTIPNVELVIVGDGPLRKKLEGLAQSLLKSYRFLGTQPREVIRSLLNTAKVFCVPSVTIENGNSEGFGMVFAEANSMGVPVVSFNTGGIPEAVAHGETGLLAPEKDFYSLGKYIIQLLSDRDLWERFSINGEKRVRKNFNLHKQNQGLEKIYNNLIINEKRKD